ncbi:MAG: hypothetical protein KIT83_22575 [Bryobacterales bacterium]|nr:hypothetical protein [Bryobacterales bacterium]
MELRFWVPRLAAVFAIAFLIIAASQLLKGHSVEDAITHGLLWAAITSTIFNAGRFWNLSRCQRCAVPKAGQEMQAKR